MYGMLNGLTKSENERERERNQNGMQNVLRVYNADSTMELALSQEYLCVH